MLVIHALKSTVPVAIITWSSIIYCIQPQIAKFMGPTWGPSGADRTQVGPMLAPWTLLSGALRWLKQNTNKSLINWRKAPQLSPSQSYGASGCFLWCQPKQMTKQTVELPLIWDVMMLVWHHCNVEIILGMGSANESQHYNVTLSLIGWAHTQNYHCNVKKELKGFDPLGHLCGNTIATWFLLDLSWINCDCFYRSVNDIKRQACSYWQQYFRRESYNTVKPLITWNNFSRYSQKMHQSSPMSVRYGLPFGSS